MRTLVVDKEAKLTIQEIPIPQPNDYQVLVKMISCGICNGTDMKLIHRKFKGYDKYPAILGHEGVGKVIERGKKVKSFEMGDYVLKPRLYEQVNGHYPAWGGFSEYAIANDWRAMAQDGKGPGTDGFLESYYIQQVIPRDFDPVSSAMINTFREVLSSFKRFEFKENKSIVVFGCGSVGLSFIRFAKILGMGPVIACDIQDEKFEPARMIGADYAFNNKNADVKKEILKICPDGVDYVVDAVGCTDIINQAMELIKFNGKICVYGISANLYMQLDWSKAPYNWDLQFIQWPIQQEEAAALNQIVNWIKYGMLKSEDFISHVIEFDQIIDAFNLITQGKARKIIIKFE